MRLMRIQPQRSPSFTSRRPPWKASLRQRRPSSRPRLPQIVSAEMNVTFRVQHHVNYGERMAILGGSASLGNWNKDQAVPLTWTEGDVWVLDLTFETKDNVEYKYVRVNGEGEVQEWAPGANLVLDFEAFQEDCAITVEDAWDAAPKKAKAAAPKKPAPPPTTVHAPRERKPAPSLVEEGGSHGSGKVIDIGGPVNAPNTVYTVEQNPILSSMVGGNIKLPAFPIAPW